MFFPILYTLILFCYKFPVFCNFTQAFSKNQTTPIAEWSACQTTSHEGVGKIPSKSTVLKVNPIFHRRPIQHVCFFPVGLSWLIHFQQVLWVLKFLLSPGLGS